MLLVLGSALLFHNHYPRFTGAPSCRFRTLTRRPVAERRARKADAYERSPAPIPEQHKPEAAKQLWRNEMKLLMKHNFTTEEKREIKASFSEERKATRKGGSDLASVRKELAAKRARLASEASKRGPEGGR